VTVRALAAQHLSAVIASLAIKRPGVFEAYAMTAKPVKTSVMAFSSRVAQTAA
jgi:hypothetical protein